MNKVIINKYEINGYQDSDFIAVVLDRDAKKLERITYGTTRGHIDRNYLEGIEEGFTEEDYEIAKALIVEEHYTRPNIVKPGDTVKIVKGRKYPIGTEFVFDHYDEYRDRYGRVQTTYACNKDESIKTSIHNCELVKLGRDHIYLELVRS